MRFAFLVLLSLPFVEIGQAQEYQVSLPTPYIQQGPDGPTSLSASPDGTLLASGDIDGVRIYNLRYGREILTLPHYAVDSIAFSPDGNWLASAGRDQLPALNTGPVHFSLRLWPIVNGTISSNTAQFIDPCSPATRIGVVAFASNRQMAALACDDQEVVLWNLDANAKPIHIKLPSSAKCLQFSPDGAALATGLYNGVAMIWDSATGTSLRSLGTPGDIATALTYSPDGETLAVSRKEQISLWNAATGILVKAISVPRDTVASMTFRAGGQFLATGGFTGVAVFDITTGKVSKTFHPFFTNVTAVTYTPDGSLLAGAAWSQVIVWDSETGREQYSFNRRTNSIDQLQLTLDRKRLIAESQLEIKGWDYQKGTLLGTISKPPSLPGQRSPDDKHFASIGVGGTSIYRSADGVLERTLTPHDPITTAIAFAPDNKSFASGGADGLIRIWDLSTGPPLTTIDTNDPDRNIDVEPGFSVRDPRTMWKNIVSALVFSEDGQWLAGVASNGSNGQTIRIWDTHSAHEIRRLPSSSFISTIAFDPSRKRLASADDKGTITLWNLDTGTALTTFTADTSSVSSLLFDPGRNVLVSGSMNGEILIWDLSTNTLLVRLVSTGPNDWLTIAPNGLFDGTSDAMRQVGWKVPTWDGVIPLESFYNDFFEPGIYAKTVNGHQPKPPLDFLAALQLPGLREMLEEELVSIETRDGQPTLCLPEIPTVNPALFREAQPMHFDPQDLVPHPGDSSCRFGLKLDRGAQYELANSSQLSSRSSRAAVDKVLNSDVAASTLNVQTIAIGNYNFDATGLRSLPSSVRGAKSLETFFREPRHKSGPYQNVRVWDGLYDEAATRQGILDRLGEIGKALSQNDVLVLFLSGHGIVPAGQEMFYFAPFDLEGPDPRRERETGLNTAMLVDAMRNIRAARILLVIDACQSGGALESLEKLARLKSDLDEDQSGSYLIMSSTPLEEAIAPITGDDVLVSTLLAAFHTGPTGHALSIRDLTRYVRKELPRLSNDPNYQQTPMIVEVGVDFPIAIPEEASARN
jgi:WD40 repeat protein